MLINFKVKNFRSFKEEIEFSMEAGSEIEVNNESHVSVLGEYHLLKSAVLFGANASGKSNFIKALELLVFLVTKPTQDVDEPLHTNTFFGNSENTSFRIEFIKNLKHYIYQLEVNEKEVVVERLIIDNDVYFERQKQEFLKVSQTIKNYIKNIRTNQLLLFVAQSQNDEEVFDAYKWFKSDLIIADSYDRRTDLMIAFKLYSQNKTFQKRLVSLLKYADLNIEDIEILLNVPWPLPRDYSIWSYIITTHRDELGNVFKINMVDESEGTKKFVLVVLELLCNINDGKVIVFDEFNSSFHLELSHALLDLINREKQNNQFILTTHELSLMDHDLRQDQIYLTEKNCNGSTDLYSLFDFNDPELKRDDVSYKRRYLDGRYRGIPIISSGVMKCILEEEDVETK